MYILRKSRQSRDLDCNEVHIDTAFVDDVECRNGKDDNKSALDLDTKTRLMPLTKSDVRAPLVVDD